MNYICSLPKFVSLILYQGEPMIVATSIKAKDKKTGEDRMVLVTWINKEKLQVAWIEIRVALEKEEVRLKRWLLYF